MKLSNRTIQHYIEAMEWEHCPEYGERGYHIREDGGQVVLGDFWVRKGQRGYVEGPLQSHEQLHPRFWSQMEEQGFSFEWEDEWVIDYENGKAYRCQPDSYSWERSFVYDEYGNMLTPDSDIVEWLAWATNEETRCLTKAMVPDLIHELALAGFEQYNGRYENGWYDGQNDTPAKAIERIRRDHGDVDFLFTINYISQFDMGFNAWVRLEEGHDDDPNL